MRSNLNKFEHIWVGRGQGQVEGGPWARELYSGVRVMCRDSPHVNRITDTQTDTTENITFLQLQWRRYYHIKLGVKKSNETLSICTLFADTDR